MGRRHEKRHSKADFSSKRQKSVENMVAEKLGYTLNIFEEAIRTFGFRDNCGNSSGKKSNM